MLSFCPRGKDVQLEPHLLLDTELNRSSHLVWQHNHFLRGSSVDGSRHTVMVVLMQPHASQALHASHLPSPSHCLFTYVIIVPPTLPRRLSWGRTPTHVFAWRISSLHSFHYSALLSSAMSVHAPVAHLVSPDNALAAWILGRDNRSQQQFMTQLDGKSLRSHQTVIQIAANPDMATPGYNRYALFASADDNATATRVTPPDPSKNPFLNQVADDSIPWEKVKKRGAPVMASVSQPLTDTKHRAKAASIQQLLNNRQKSTAPVCATEEKPHDPHENWCGVCSLKLPNKTALQNHIKQSPNHQNYCNLCKRVFKDRNGLKNHVDNSLGHDTYCNLCLSAFKDQWGLKNHFENNYSVGHEFVCLTCLTGFNTSAELDRHLQTAETHTWCQTCQRRFRNQDERDEHWVKTLSK